MSATSEEELLSQSFQELTGSPPTTITVLMQHASERRIYRLEGAGQKVIGVLNRVPPENDTFVYLARHFRSLGLPVPEIYHYSPQQHLYLEEDLGDTTLLDFLQAERPDPATPLPNSVLDTYRAVLDYLPRFQVEAARTLDFSRCFPNADFSSHALKVDMQSFSRDLVGRLLPGYDQTGLDFDFDTLIKFLADATNGFFVYRDFQSRNVMLVGGAPYFIDFQGGRRGPLQYDVVSLLCQVSAGLSESDKASLVDHYLTAVARYVPIKGEEFHLHYNGFVVSRMLQVLGVYGRQGLGGGKEYFKRSIPTAIRNLSRELSAPSFPLRLDALRACVDKLTDRIEKES